jgi:NAD(P)-dependent dehydrogenase (short-subunit alcohol dehydrogenase family)
VLLEDKNAVIYGGGGAIGGAVARAFAREGARVTRQGSGVILAFGGSGDPMRGYYLGGLQVAFHAIESMRRQLASELGSQGMRVVTLRTAGIPESLPEASKAVRRSPRGSRSSPCWGGPRPSKTWETRPRSLPATGPGR